MSLVYVTRTVRFNAAHRLHNPEKSDAWNRDTYGKCNNPSFHGHNYKLEVTVAGEPDEETGYVVDLSEVKRIVNERVITKMDHSNLNLDVDFLNGIMPSTENIAIAIWRQLEGSFPNGLLYCVRLFETENNLAEYYGD